MRHSLRIAVTTIGVVLLACTLAEAGGNVNFVIASRHLDDDSWGDLQNQAAFNAVVDFSPENWPLHWVFGIGGSARSRDNGDDLSWFHAADRTGYIGELTFGVAFVPLRGQTRPFIGGGIAKTFERLEVRDQPDETDNSFGWYLNGGVYWRLGAKLNLGIDGRILGGTSGRLAGIDRSSNYKQIGLLIGFGF